jgi:acyl-CoA synthetase (AMP-forming)/AMP-acid ligase II
VCAVHANDTAMLLYSSGTIGFPEGVKITHINFVANALQLSFMVDLDSKDTHPQGGDSREENRVRRLYCLPSITV